MIVAIIPAKGKSNRLPNKNMSLIHENPMIYYTVKYAEKSNLINDIFISTDDQKIETYSIELGIKTIHRPDHLCGEAMIIDVYRHAFNTLKSKVDIKMLVGLQPDHPDRKLDLDHVIKKFQKDKVDQLISVEKNGTKNGAHFILSKEVLIGKTPEKISKVVDDCTNVHTKEDLEIAKRNIF